MVENKILSLIKENAYIPVPVTEISNLYTDLGFDSLAFITLLSKIENEFEITFGIAEMEPCLCVRNLIEAVERKLK